jgi:flagellin
MYINTNAAALQAWDNLMKTQMESQQVLAQLSSGYRINSAADDPAGLAISENMLSQIDGLQQANLNAQAGISLIQTADGALSNIQTILQSMRSLASEAATSTENPADLQALQAEMNQYAQEITQIVNTTQFNNINLLGGGFQNQAFQIGANEGQTLQVSIQAADAYTLGVTGLNIAVTSATPALIAGTPQGVGLGVGTYTVTETTNPWSTTSGTGKVADVTGITGTYTGTQSQTWSVTVNTFTAGTGGQVTVMIGNTSYTEAVNASNQFSLNGLTVTLATTTAPGDTFGFTVVPQTSTISVTGPTNLSGTVTGAIAQGQQIQIGGTTGAALTFNQLAAVPYQSATYTSIGAAPTALPSLSDTVSVTQNGNAATVINGQVVKQASATTGLDITSQADAEAALAVLDNAINTISGMRANLGAYQNRLQFAQSDVQTTQLNLQNARAGIMDTDMALQMANLSKDQILLQSGIAMLAQADAMPQALLKLLG